MTSALLWQQLGRLACTCTWFEIAKSATDTTESGDESSHCLEALATWQQSSYPISTILNPSGLKRPELESDNSPPLNAGVKKTWTPLHCTLSYTECLFYRCPEHGSCVVQRARIGTFGDSCLADRHGKRQPALSVSWIRHFDIHLFTSSLYFVAGEWRSAEWATSLRHTSRQEVKLTVAR